MHLHFLAPVVLLALACDFIEPGECLSPGYMFGPCVNGNCAEDRLHCTQTPGGDQCTVEVEAVDAGEAAECAMWRGNLSVDANDLYYVSCQTPGDCRGGTVCSSGFCVYPQ